MRSSSLVAIWDHNVRLHVDIQLKDGRLVAQAADTSDLDFDEWEPIDDVVSKFIRLAQTIPSSSMSGRRLTTMER